VPLDRKRASRIAPASAPDVGRAVGALDAIKRTRGYSQRRTRKSRLFPKAHAIQVAQLFIAEKFCHAGGGASAFGARSRLAARMSLFALVGQLSHRRGRALISGESVSRPGSVRIRACRSEYCSWALISLVVGRTRGFGLFDRQVRNLHGRNSGTQNIASTVGGIMPR